MLRPLNEGSMESRFPPPLKECGFEVRLGRASWPGAWEYAADRSEGGEDSVRMIHDTSTCRIRWPIP